MASVQNSVPPTFSTHHYAPQRLRALFEPRSIALIGASDKSTWSWMLHGILSQSHYPGRLYYINPRNSIVHGQPAIARVADIGEAVDLGFVMVPLNSLWSVLQEMVDAGIRNAVILTSGFGETDDEGKQRQRDLIEFAHKHDLVFLGPNCMGFINATANVRAMPAANPPIVMGGVTLISQSGALTGSMFSYAYTHNVGLNALISTGNEAALSISDVMDYAIENESTKVIALFLESIRSPEHFREVAQRALQRGKPIVVHKIGRSETSARVAQAHTGAFVGDDRVIDALFRQTGVVRVNSIEDLIITAGVLDRTGVLPGKRLGFCSISGGACDAAADRAEQEHIILPTFAEETKQKLREVLPVLGPVNNPLDTTGAAVTNVQLFEQILTPIGNDPNVDVLMCAMSLPTNIDSPTSVKMLSAFLESIKAGLDKAACPAFLIDMLDNEISDNGRKVIEDVHLPILPGGMDRSLAAIGKAMWWSERYRAAQKAQQLPTQTQETQLDSTALAKVHETARGRWSESQARTLLQQFGIPVIPAQLVNSADEAMTAATTLGLPVALKIASPDILHKSDIGGVCLNLHSEDEVRNAFTQIMQSSQAITPTPHIEGVLVSPMRSEGVELLVGVVQDAAWGLALAVGIGGIYVEILKDTSLRVLPVTRDDIQMMLDELQGKALLQGARGSKVADIDALVEVIYQISTLAVALQDNLESLEINPLRVDGSQIEALDVLVTWKDDSDN